MVLPFTILATVPFIMVLGNSMLIPVFPLMERELNLTQFQVGLLVTAFSIPAGVVIPFAGALSDHVGRKKIMFPALLLYGIGGLLAGAASIWITNPYTWILVGRVIQGIGAGGTYQIALALTGDLFQSEERSKAVGILEAANGMGKVVSPVAGSALGLLFWFAPFFAYGILSIPIAFAVWLIVKEPKSAKKKQSPKEYLTSLGAIFKKKAGPLLTTYLAGAVGLFLLFGLLSFISDELETSHNMTGIVKGLVLAIPVAVMTLVAYAAGLLMQRRDSWLLPAILIGLAAAGAGLAGLAFVDGLLALIGFSSVMGFGIGMKLPALNTIVTSATDSDERGLITALYGTVRFFGVALGPPAFGLAQDGGKLPMFLAGAAIAFVAFALVWLFVKPKKVMVEQDSSSASQSQSEDNQGENQAHPTDARTQPAPRNLEPDHCPF